MKLTSAAVGRSSSHKRWSIEMRNLPIILSFAVLALVYAPTVGATPASGVTIHTHLFVSPLPPHGTFTASLPVCPSGTFMDEEKTVGGAFTGAQTSLFVATIVKHFTCGDGSGTFDIQFHPHFQTLGSQSGGPWNVVGGSGAYTSMHGTGDFAIVFLPGSFLVEGSETFTGQVHFD
jgi:hypothetical protein